MTGLAHECPDTSRLSLERSAVPSPNTIAGGPRRSASARSRPTSPSRPQGRGGQAPAEPRPHRRHGRRRHQRRTGARHRASRHRHGQRSRHRHEFAGITLVKGDLEGIVRPATSAALSSATSARIYSSPSSTMLGVPVAAGVLYPFFGFFSARCSLPLL